MWAAAIAMKRANWVAVACGGLAVLAACSVSQQPSESGSGATAAEQIAIIDAARRACAVRIQVMGRGIAEGDAGRSIGLARNARSSCDEGFSTIYDLKPPKGSAPVWREMLEDCQSSLRLWGDAAKAAEALAENSGSPTNAYEARQAILAATEADGKCVAGNQAVLAKPHPTAARASN